MAETPAKAPKKEKDRRQTPEERLESMKYNHMMYGPTDGERRVAIKKVDYGASYLKHPKFQSLIAAFTNGTAYKFEVNANGRPFTVSTDGTEICFNGRTIYYSRNLNRYENNLLLDRESMIQYQTTDALVHLAFAVLRSFPELGPLPLTYLNQMFYFGGESLESMPAENGANLLVGCFKHKKVPEKSKFQRA